MKEELRKKYNFIKLIKIPYRVIQCSIILYILSMFLIFPLYYQNKYYNMGEAKYDFFKYATGILFAVVLSIGLVGLLLNLKDISFPNSIRKAIARWSVTDCFVFLYALAVFVSFALTPYQKTAFWGYTGWYMGLVSQLSFVILYFLVSRFYRQRQWFLHAACIASAIVFLLAILHRFQIDPLHLYDGLTIYNKIMFLSTIGQATWYSSFLCVVFPIGLFLYWSSKGWKQRILYGLYVGIGFATAVTQNSDSAFIAFGLMLLILFCFSFRAAEAMKRYLEILLLGLLACKIIGILQVCFSDKVVPLEPLSIFVSQSKVTLVLLLLIFVVYLLFCYMHAKGKIAMASLRMAPKIVSIAAVIMVLLVILCVYLITTGKAPEILHPFKEIGYFNFNDEWGNGRGFTWKYAADMFREYSLPQKLFGCGPDSFASYSYEFHAAELSAKWGSNTLTNAHNEWFTSLLFFGIFGMVTYMGIFVSTAVRGIKRAQEAPFLIAVIMSIAAYMGHNFFCYQQIVCTPLIFMLMGMGEGTMRRWEQKKKRIEEIECITTI